MFHSVFRSLTFPAPLSAFSTQDDRLPALFGVGPGAYVVRFSFIQGVAARHEVSEEASGSTGRRKVNFTQDRQMAD